MLISKTIDGALRLIGVLAAGEEASPEEHADGLECLNGMIDGFNADGLIISYLQEKSYPAPGGTWGNRVTIGATGDIVDTAPADILGAFFRDGSGTDKPLFPLTVNQWVESDKNIVETPSKYLVNYHAQSVTLTFDTIPNPSDELRLMVKMPYSTTNVPTDDITWDYGFEEMLRYQLAVRLAAEYGVQLRPDVALLTAEFLDRVKVKGYTPSILSIDKGLLQ